MIKKEEIFDAIKATALWFVISLMRVAELLITILAFVYTVAITLPFLTALIGKTVIALFLTLFMGFIAYVIVSCITEWILKNAFSALYAYILRKGFIMDEHMNEMFAEYSSETYELPRMFHVHNLFRKVHD